MKLLERIVSDVLEFLGIELAKYTLGEILTIAVVWFFLWATLYSVLDKVITKTTDGPTNRADHVFVFVVSLGLSIACIVTVNYWDNR